MINYTIGLVRRKGPIIFDRLIGKWVTENSQLSKTTTQTSCSGVPCAFIRIVGTFLLPCGGGLASALLLRVGETCFFIFSSRIHFPSGRNNLNLEERMAAVTKRKFDVNNVETVQSLISENKINVNRRVNGSPLVSVSPNPDVIKLLIEHNVNLNELDDNGKPPIFCHIDNMEIFDILVEAKADLLFKVQDGRSLLHEISNKIASNSEELSAEIAMMEKLISLGIPVDIQDQLGRTPLFGTKHPEKAWALIKAGANVNHHSREQRANSPLLYCACNVDGSNILRDIRLAQLLLDNGADRDHCDLYGYCFAHLFWRNFECCNTLFNKLFKLLSKESFPNDILNLLEFPYWVPCTYSYGMFENIEKSFKQNPLCNSRLSFSHRLSWMKSRDKKSAWWNAVPLVSWIILSILFFWLIPLLIPFNPSGLIILIIAICFTFLISEYYSAKSRLMCIQLQNIIRKHNPEAVPAAIAYNVKLNFVQKLLMKIAGYREDQKDLIR